MTNKKNDSISVFVQPTSWLEVDEPFASELGVEPDVAAVIRYVCMPHDPSVDAIVTRYREIAGESGIFALPYESEFAQRITLPLRQAKASYCLGHFLGTVVLAGFDGEMLAVLIYEIVNVSAKSRVDEHLPWGKRLNRKKRFDEATHFDRSEALKKADVIGEVVFDRFDELRRLRNDAVHGVLATEESLRPSGQRAFRLAAQLVVDVATPSVSGGRLTFRKELLNYLRNRASEGSRD